MSWNPCVQLHDVLYERLHQSWAQGFPQYLQQYDMNFRGSGAAAGQPYAGAGPMDDPSFVLQVPRLPRGTDGHVMVLNEMPRVPAFLPPYFIFKVHTGPDSASMHACTMCTPSDY